MYVHGWRVTPVGEADQLIILTIREENITETEKHKNLSGDMWKTLIRIEIGGDVYA